jgi:hypothetical protein
MKQVAGVPNSLNHKQNTMVISRTRFARTFPSP